MRRILIAMALATSMISVASAQTATATATETFVTAQPTDVLSYNLIGLNIVDAQNKTIGEIKDLILSEGKLAGYIVSVGGVLGLGEKYVIVAPSAVKVSYSENDKKWTAGMAATEDQLKAAPEFKYEGRWKK
ncbi:MULTISPECIES: PRC-barrel domain-containing protein [Phyllobacterium]|jgi:sporulation protein YlmC with PRC-barrel domain|uniref:PRC-barrel domain-containing protein n=1 Tax=Phyllobacterium TaxID=28100 RepID=UPI001CBBE568|nr:PRC-barrel domain-containing protein [Phyllobacterium calauticae]MBZ3695398.1 PRC-barrel domain-containing protein [Phyllobacterium calauticae]